MIYIPRILLRISRSETLLIFTVLLLIPYLGNMAAATDKLHGVHKGSLSGYQLTRTLP